MYITEIWTEERCFELKFVKAGPIAQIWMW